MKPNLPDFFSTTSSTHGTQSGALKKPFLEGCASCQMYLTLGLFQTTARANLQNQHKVHNHLQLEALSRLLALCCVLFPEHMLCCKA